MRLYRLDRYRKAKESADSYACRLRRSMDKFKCRHKQNIYQGLKPKICGAGTWVSDSEIKEILENHKNVAVVGLSHEKTKYSYIVAEYLKGKGYRIIPINPFDEEILGEKCYKSLLEMPEELQNQVEIVDIFRPSDKIMPVVDEAVEIRKKHDKLKVVWMQLGIINEEAARKAEASRL